jgi:hypothetical protein
MAKHLVTHISGLVGPNTATWLNFVWERRKTRGVREHLPQLLDSTRRVIPNAHFVWDRWGEIQAAERSPEKPRGVSQDAQDIMAF